MTASITRCCKSALEAGLALLLALALGSARADIEVHSAALSLGEEAVLLSVDARTELNPVLEEVVARGVPLYFVAEFELTRARWYWFDEKVAQRSLTYRLSYHAITRQYRLSTGALHQNFSSLAEALHLLARLRDWPVAERGVLRPGESYQAAFRLRLDLAQLPKPIQITAIGARDWSLGSEWLRWTYVTDPP